MLIFDRFIYTPFIYISFYFFPSLWMVSLIHVFLLLANVSCGFVRYTCQWSWHFFNFIFILCSFFLLILFFFLIHQRYCNFFFPFFLISLDLPFLCSQGLNSLLNFGSFVANSHFHRPKQKKVFFFEENTIQFQPNDSIVSFKLSPEELFAFLLYF